jgi:sodium-dependent dicarboxylate transporter 2/3/5
MFCIPVDLRRGKFLLDWTDTKFVDWGTLILFGGGIALSDSMFKTGLASWIAHSFIGMLGSPSTLLMVFAIVVLVDFLTEVTSNTAVTTMMVPIVISVALATGENPVTLAVATALAASMAFMLPVATPPNALVYATGYVKLKDMVKGGIILDIFGWLFTVGIIVVFGVWMFGVLGL